MLKLKLQYFGHLMWRADSLEKTLMLGKIEGRRRRGQEEKRTEDKMVGWHKDSMDMSLSKLWEMVKDREAWRAAVHELDMTEWLNNNSRSWVHGFLLGPLALCPLSPFCLAVGVVSWARLGYWVWFRNDPLTPIRILILVIFYCPLRDLQKRHSGREHACKWNQHKKAGLMDGDSWWKGSELLNSPIYS